MLDSFTRGFVVGLAVSMPVGPIGLLCIQRSMTLGWLRGMAAGLGATAADLVYAALAAFGIAFINDFLVQHADWFRLPAAGLLFLMGYRAFRDRPAEGAAAGSSIQATFAATFSLMLSNPLTLVFFTAVLAALGGSGEAAGGADALLLILGVGAGSILWWSILAGAGSLLRGRFRPASLVWIHRITGTGLIAFGFWLLLQAAKTPA